MLVATRYLFAGLALLIAIAGCRDVTGLPLPPEAVPMQSVPASYRAWWDEVEACSGRRRLFAWVQWYYVPNTDHFVRDGVAYGAFWLSHPDRIILAEAYLDDAGVVRHEMLHALLQDGEHPAEYFEQRCGTLVA